MPRFDPDVPVNCVLCRRDVPGRLITLHHLKPKSRGGGATSGWRPAGRATSRSRELPNKELAAGFDDVDALKPKSRGGGADVRVATCRTCHKQIHATFTNKELDRGFDDVQALRGSDRLSGFLGWVRKQKPDRVFGVARSAAKPRRRR